MKYVRPTVHRHTCSGSFARGRAFLLRPRDLSQAKTETSLKYTGGGPTPTLYHTHAVRDTARRAESVLRLRDTQSAPYAPQTSLEISQRVC